MSDFSPTEIQSNAAEEIIGTIPSWIIRHGIAVFFFVGIVGLAVSYFIQYPDTVNVDVIMKAENQPGKVIISRNDANQIFKYLVEDGDVVNPGDTLVTLTNKKTGGMDVTITPMSGTIYMTNGENEKNLLKDIIWVVPKSNKVKIRINYGNKGAGNVKIGQIVKIELYDFPESQYGFIEGQLSSILPIKENGEHIAYVALRNKDIVTSENRIIPVLPVMRGKGEVFLNNKSIFQRIFGSIF